MRDRHSLFMTTERLGALWLKQGPDILKKWPPLRQDSQCVTHCVTQNKYRDQEAQDAARSEDSWCLPNQPILGKELWRDVRKLTVSDLRNWSVVRQDPSEWNGMLDTMEQFIAANHERSLARAIVTWNSTLEEPLLPNGIIGTVVFPTSSFLTLLGKGYRFNEGSEARREREIYQNVMLGTETEMVRTAHDLHLEYVLNDTQYFQHAVVLNACGPRTRSGAVRVRIASSIAFVFTRSCCP
jgi:hypothetical protein